MRGQEIGSTNAQSFSRFETDQVLIADKKLLDTAKYLQRDSED